MDIKKLLIPLSVGSLTFMPVANFAIIYSNYNSDSNTVKITNTEKTLNELDKGIFGETKFSPLEFYTFTSPQDSCGDQQLSLDGFTSNAGGNGFNTPSWDQETNSAKFDNCGGSKDLRAIAQKFKIDFFLPAHCNKIQFNIKFNFALCGLINYRLFGSAQYFTTTQLFYLGQDANTRPNYISNYAYGDGEDTACVYKYKTDCNTNSSCELHYDDSGCYTIKDLYNTSDEDIVESRYIMVSHLIKGSPNDVGDNETHMQVSFSSSANAMCMSRNELEQLKIKEIINASVKDVVDEKNFNAEYIKNNWERIQKSFQETHAKYPEIPDLKFKSSDEFIEYYNSHKDEVKQQFINVLNCEYTEYLKTSNNIVNGWLKNEWSINDTVGCYVYNRGATDKSISFDTYTKWDSSSEFSISHIPHKNCFSFDLPNYTEYTSSVYIPLKADVIIPANKNVFFDLAPSAKIQTSEYSIDSFARQWQTPTHSIQLFSFGEDSTAKPQIINFANFQSTEVSNDELDGSSVNYQKKVLQKGETSDFVANPLRPVGYKDSNKNHCLLAKDNLNNPEEVTVSYYFGVAITSNSQHSGIDEDHDSNYKWKGEIYPQLIDLNENLKNVSSRAKTQEEYTSDKITLSDLNQNINDLGYYDPSGTRGVCYYGDQEKMSTNFKAFYERNRSSICIPAHSKVDVAANLSLKTSFYRDPTWSAWETNMKNNACIFGLNENDSDPNWIPNVGYSFDSNNKKEEEINNHLEFSQTKELTFKRQWLQLLIISLTFGLAIVAGVVGGVACETIYEIYKVVDMVLISDTIYYWAKHFVWTFYLEFVSELFLKSTAMAFIDYILIESIIGLSCLTVSLCSAFSPAMPVANLSSNNSWMEGGDAIYDNIYKVNKTTLSNPSDKEVTIHLKDIGLGFAHSNQRSVEHATMSNVILNWNIAISNYEKI